MKKWPSSKKTPNYLAGPNNFTGIKTGLSAPDFRELSIDQLKSNGRQPFIHPGGFIRLPLDPQGLSRLHIWPTSSYKQISSIHDHIYSYRSRILAGVLTHTPHHFNFDPISGDHQVFEAVETKGQSITLNELPMLARVKTLPPELYYPGDEYSFPAFIPHTISHQALAATLTWKTHLYPGHKPQVIIPLNTHPKLNHHPIRLTQNQTWELIEEVLSQYQAA